jgi:hypothetical protein
VLPYASGALRWVEALPVTVPQLKRMEYGMNAQYYTKAKRSGLMLLIVSWLLTASSACSSFTTPPISTTQVDVWTSLGPEHETICALSIDPATPTTLYAGAGGNIVLKSTNGGASWSATNIGTPSDNPIEHLAIDPATPTTLYAGTESGGAFVIHQVK